MEINGINVNIDLNIIGAGNVDILANTFMSGGIPGIVVNLTASANSGFNFIRWGTGETSSSINISSWPNYTDSINVGSVTAYFEGYQLSINISGNGSVSMSPEKEWYNNGEEVELLANPDPYYHLSQWSGTNDDSSVENLNTVIMDDNKTVSVTFEQNDMYELSTVVNEGNGSFSSPSTSPVNKFAGEVVDLTVIPDSEWMVKRWIGADNIPNEGSNTNQITMPNEDKTVYVEFVRAPYYLTIGDSSNGSIINPSQDGYFEVNKNVQLEAEPVYGYKVSGWSGTNNDSSTNKLNSVTMDSDKTVSVSFEEATYYNISTNVSGNGSIVPDSGSYPEGHTVVLKAIPDTGYSFKRWVNLDNDMEVSNISGNELNVTVTEDKSITAVFEQIPSDIETDFDIDSELSTVFYCPEDDYKTNLIEFNYNNIDTTKKYHFKITFYSDIEMTNLVYSAFSLIDTKRWYVDNGIFSSISFDGIEISEDETIKIMFDPEILPEEKNNLQKERQINDNGFKEIPLLAGVKYYIVIEAYSEDDIELEFVDNKVIQIFTNEVKNYKWGYKEDEKKWICSANKNDDLKISVSDEQSLLSGTVSNLFENFIITWQEKMDIGYIIKGAMWDSKKDKFYASGQGMYDKNYLVNLINPITITDHSENFYISGNNQNNIYSNNCPLPTEAEQAEESQNIFDDTCYPGYSNLLSSKLFKMRVYQDDIISSITIDRDKVLPVVNQQDVNLEVSGVYGAYAVRLRDDKDDTWGDWLNIGASLYNNENTNRAYFIDSDRFIVSHDIPLYNGIRRICCEVLTFYGRTKTICMELFANLDIIQYSIKLYSDNSYSNEVPLYKGYPVLSQHLEQESIDNDYVNIYIKINFNIEQDIDDLKFNIIQEGLNDKYDIPLVKENNKEFRGSFKLYKNDGIFNKDGYGFIEIVYPNGESLFNTSDKYNLTISAQDNNKYNDVKSSDAIDTYLKNKSLKVLDINNFKQYYNKDNFDFGNPDIYRK